MDVSPDLIETLRDAQRFGFFGDRDVVEAARHARSFVDAIGSLPAGARVVDLGSGGGLPGLVLADEYREHEVTLLDRREKRTDFLQRAVRRLGWTHVRVLTDDARRLVVGVRDGDVSPFDVVTARGFGPPEFTVRTARSLCRAGGVIVISEPPVGDRWDPTLLSELGLTSERLGSVRRFVVGPLDPESGP